jgi:Zn-dependent peptidase ImmA (M78 family)
LPDVTDRDISANLAFHIRNAYERRELALELYEDMREEATVFPLRATLSDNPEDIAKVLRTLLGINDDEQKRAARQGRAFDFWRRRFEEKGILVFVVSGPHYAVDLREMRGFAIARTRLPVVVVNGRDSSEGGRTFTLLHELVHILLGESALSNGTGDFNSRTEERRIERFCDTVAAATLMPRELVLSFSEARAAGERTWTDEVLGNISRTIGVSRQALLIRLITLNRATWNFYRQKADQWEEERLVAIEHEDKKSVPIKRPVLLMSWNGRSYTRLVLRSYYDRRITLNDVSSYLGAKVKYIPDLERAAFQGAER